MSGYPSCKLEWGDDSESDNDSPQQFELFEEKPPTMPVAPAGHNGLGSILKYAIELRAYEVMSGKVSKRKISKFKTNIFRQIHINFVSK